MKVFLTGATGFVGSHALPALLAAGHEVQALIRPGSEWRISPEIAANPAFQRLSGDVLDPASLRRISPDCGAAVHLVGIIRERPPQGITFHRHHLESTRNVAEAARRAGIGRFVHMSALGARNCARARYYQSKYDAEAAVKSAPGFVIFRPSLIYGPRDHFVSLQKKLIQPLLPTVVPGGGKNLMQPVAVEDVVQGLVQALDSPKCAGKIYEIGGPHRLALDQILGMIAEAKGVGSSFRMPVPIGLLMAAAAALQRFPAFPITVDQLRMLQEDNVCDARPYYEDFEISPTVLTVEGLRRAL